MEKKVIVNCLEPIDKVGNTLFHSLAVNENWEDFQKMWCSKEFQHISDKNKQNKKGVTPLHIVALKGHVTTCELIIACKVEDKNPAANNGYTPLCFAVQKNHIKICDLLLKNVKNKLPINDQGSTPFHAAAHLGHLEICKLFFQNLAEKDKLPTNSNGLTPFHEATEKGHIEIVKLFLHNNGVIQEPSDNKGITPLHIAVINSNLEICKLLLKQIENKEPKDDNGDTPLHFAAGVTVFNPNICHLLLQNAREKNPYNKKGVSALHRAAMMGFFPMFKAIAKTLKDKNPQTLNGLLVTPLHLATEKASEDQKIKEDQNGSVEICAYILKHIVDKNPRDFLGRTPLHIAAARGNLSLYKLFLTQERNPEAYDGITPLHMAAKFGHFLVFEWIFHKIKNQDKKNPECKLRMTPLHFAAQIGSVGIVRLILESKDVVDKNPENLDGKTPLDFADGHRTILTLFQQFARK